MTDNAKISGNIADGVTTAEGGGVYNGWASSGTIITFSSVTSPCITGNKVLGPGSSGGGVQRVNTSVDFSPSYSSPPYIYVTGNIPTDVVP